MTFCTFRLVSVISKIGSKMMNRLFGKTKGNNPSQTNLQAHRAKQIDSLKRENLKWVYCCTICWRTIIKIVPTVKFSNCRLSVFLELSHLSLNDFLSPNILAWFTYYLTILSCKKYYRMNLWIEILHRSHWTTYMYSFLIRFWWVVIVVEVRFQCIVNETLLMSQLS